MADKKPSEKAASTKKPEQKAEKPAKQAAPKAEAKSDAKTKADAPKKEAAPATKESVALTGLGGVLGVKAGMTQVYDKNGDAFAVTVIDVRPSVITQVKTKEKDGYQGVQVGFLDKTKTKKLKNCEKGHLKKSGSKGFYHYQEFRLPDDAKTDELKVGSTLSCSFIKDGDLVDLSAVSKGKGFQGVMKRHHFSGGPATHGASIVHRMPGSIGNRSDPSKVFKGKKMAGHMGNKKVTIQNVRVFKVDEENQCLLIHGSVPGPKSGVVTIRRAVKSAG